MPRTSNVPVKVLVVLTAGLALAGCHKRAPVTVNAPVAEAPPPGPPGPPGPPVCKLTAEPAAVEQGKSVTLSWTTQDATGVTIDQGIGKQLTEGSVSATPQSSTTYILTASGAGGSATCTARVTVTPAPPAAASVTEENLATGGAASVATQIQDAFFDYDSADLRQDAQAALTADANLLKGRAGIQFIVEGYCDQRGSEEFNLGLGQRRAAAARDFLVNLGIPANDISTVSYGKDRLSCTENTEECWQKNRRVRLNLQLK